MAPAAMVLLDHIARKDTDHTVAFVRFPNMFYSCYSEVTESVFTIRPFMRLGLVEVRYCSSLVMVEHAAP